MKWVQVCPDLSRLVGRVDDGSHEECVPEHEHVVAPRRELWPREDACEVKGEVPREGVALGAGDSARGAVDVRNEAVPQVIRGVNVGVHLRCTRKEV